MNPEPQEDDLYLAEVTNMNNDDEDEKENINEDDTLDSESAGDDQEDDADELEEELKAIVEDEKKKKSRVSGSTRKSKRPVINYSLCVKSYFSHLQPLDEASRCQPQIFGEQAKLPKDAALHTLGRLMEARGFSEWNEELMEKNELACTVVRDEERDRTMVLFWNLDIPVAAARIMRQNLEAVALKPNIGDKKNMHVLLIVRSITSSSKQLMLSLTKTFPRFHMIHIDELSRPAIDHSLVPKYEEIEEDPEVLLKRIFCKREELDVQSREDIITRFYGWPLGHIVKVWRNIGGSTPRDFTYRIIQYI
jgi:DNA-directed RNA polymerase subunit H (RpoH/RPB5)